MNNKLGEIKFQTCNICSAMLRNINDNFLNISFDIENGDVQVKIILEKKTNVEQDYIDDLITEFSALQSSDCVKRPIVEVGAYYQPLNNIVYRRV